eukprot:5715456-Prymnesium_polylepis.1
MRLRARPSSRVIGESADLFGALAVPLVLAACGAQGGDVPEMWQVYRDYAVSEISNVGTNFSAYQFFNDKQGIATDSTRMN